MNARVEDLFESDLEKDTLHAVFPTSFQLMCGVYGRKVDREECLEVNTHTSSGESLPGISYYTTTRISPTEPDTRQFGSWLIRYRDKIRPSVDRDSDTQLWGRRGIGRLSNQYLLARRASRNEVAIGLLQSWIDEDPDAQQAVDLLRLKEVIDEQRIDERKLFT